MASGQPARERDGEDHGGLRPDSTKSFEVAQRTKGIERTLENKISMQRLLPEAQLGRARHMTALAVVVWFAMVSAACGGSGTNAPEDDSFMNHHSIEATAPESFVDGRGRTWSKTRKVTYEDIGPEASENNTDSNAFDIRTLSLEKATVALRPVSLIGDYEYIMSETDARELARIVQLAALEQSDMNGGAGERPLGEEESGEPPLDPLKYAPTNLIGSDNRESIDYVAGYYPWNNHAVMDQQGTCSAFKLVNHHTAVTAAHCVHTGSNGNAPPRVDLGAAVSVVG